MMDDGFWRKLCKDLSPGWVKINTDGAARGILVLLLVEVFFVGVWENLLVFFQRFLKFRLFWLLSFMELYMLWRKLKKWNLLMSGLNVILPWWTHLSNWHVWRNKCWTYWISSNSCEDWYLGGHRKSFVMRLLLRLMFCGCFGINEILVLIFVGQSGLGLLIFFVKGMRVLISWLI